MEFYSKFLPLDFCNEIVNSINKKDFFLNKADNRFLYITEYIPNSFFKSFLNKIGIYSIGKTYINMYNKGCFFDRHVDRYENHPERYKTLLINLSENYEGGKFLLDDKEYLTHIGDTIIFDSDTFHEVLPVKLGVRYSLVVWLTKESFMNIKPTI